MCSHNNNIPINIPGHPYVLMNQSILCNCDIEAESNFLLESLAACKGPETKTDLEMHFTVNLAFVNYFDNINAPKTLQELAIQYKNRKNVLDKKEENSDRPENNCRFQSFLNSFLADVLIFTAVLITLIITLIIMYM